MLVISSTYVFWIYNNILKSVYKLSKQNDFQSSSAILSNEVNKSIGYWICICSYSTNIDKINASNPNTLSGDPVVKSDEKLKIKSQLQARSKEGNITNTNNGKIK